MYLRFVCILTCSGQCAATCFLIFCSSRHCLVYFTSLPSTKNGIHQWSSPVGKKAYKNLQLNRQWALKTVIHLFSEMQTSFSFFNNASKATFLFLELAIPALFNLMSISFLNLGEVPPENCRTFCHWRSVLSFCGLILWSASSLTW